MTFDPFAIVALIATAIVFSLLGKAWNEREKLAAERLVASHRGEIDSLKRLIARRELEREDSGVRERVSA